jgi:Tat protein secretion system quality control protein TatD with DNase activity
VAAAVSAPARDRSTGYRTAIDLLRSPLGEIGFRKRAGGVFTIPLTDTVIGRVGLGWATKGMAAGQALVYPTIGVRHQPLERIVAGLLGEEFHPYDPPTLAAPIGNVMPERRFEQWLIGGEDSGAQAESMVRAIVEHGLPYMRSHSDPEALRAAMEADLRHPLEYRLPVLLALLGEHAAAREAVDRHLAELGDAQNPYAEEYRAFAARFCAHEHDLSGLAA